MIDHFGPVPLAVHRFKDQRINKDNIAWTPTADAFSPWQYEWNDLIDSIRSGRPLNEGRRVAESTLTAIMGRMSAYTGRAISWGWLMKKSKLDLTPPSYTFGDLPVAPVAVPGDTPLV